MSPPLRFALFGAGFWAPFQLAGWQEVGGVECTAVYDPRREAAEALADRFGIARVFDDAEALLAEGGLDFVDNVTGVGGHVPLSRLCADRRIPTICQKPMAPSLEEAVSLVARFRQSGTPFFVHENWRWQAPLIRVRQLMRDRVVGTPLRARLTMVSGFDVFANQPALAHLDQFILTDLGAHLFDVARVLLGEAHTVYCCTSTTLAPDVRGENLATVLLTMGEARTHVLLELGYARTPLEPSRHEVFPETLIFVEGSAGSIELAPDCQIRVTTAAGTSVTRHAPRRYAWADPRYDVVHASLVPCCRDLLNGLRGGAAETTGEDNLQTLRLVFAAYDSARTGQAVGVGLRA